MKKMFFAGLAMLFLAVSISYAQPPEPTLPIKGTLDMSFTTRYVWRGFNVYGSKSAIHPSIDLFSPDLNFGFNLTVHRANSSGYETFERWDYTAYYIAKLFKDEPAEIDLNFGYMYYNFPQQSSHTRGDNPIDDPAGFTPDCGTYDLQELHLIVSAPKIIPGLLSFGHQIAEPLLVQSLLPRQVYQQKALHQDLHISSCLIMLCHMYVPLQVLIEN